MKYLDKLPEHLREPVRDAFARWWVEERGRPPTADETELFEGCREHFLSGAALCMSAVYGDGMRQRKVPQLERDAFFAGHVWRVTHQHARAAPTVPAEKDAFPSCHACGRKIPEGELFTTLSLSRERERDNAVDVIHAEILRVECSTCSVFRGCFEEAVDGDVRHDAVRRLLADASLQEWSRCVPEDEPG